MKKYIDMSCKSYHVLLKEEKPTTIQRSMLLKQAYQTNQGNHYFVSFNSSTITCTMFIFVIGTKEDIFVSRFNQRVRISLL